MKKKKIYPRVNNKKENLIFYLKLNISESRRMLETINSTLSPS